MEHATRSDEWRRRLLYCVAGLLCFETLTGLAIYLLPFSVPNQVMVLAHTAIGLAFVLPYAWYQLRHWRLYRTLRWSHEKLTGYFSMVATLALSVSGIILSVQAALSTRISYVVDLVHVVSTFALIAAALPHILTPVVRAVRARTSEAAAITRSGARTFGWRTLSVTAAMLMLVVIGIAAYRPPA